MAQAGVAADDIDEILAGFDGEPVDAVEVEEALTASPWSFGGLLGLGASYNFAHEAPDPGETDWRGLSRLRLTLELEAGLRLGDTWDLFASGHAFYDFAYTINGREDYTPQVLDRYEYELSSTTPS